MSESLNSKYEIGKVYPINVNELQPNPEQPRKYFDEDGIKALAADIEANGAGSQYAGFGMCRGISAGGSGRYSCRADNTQGIGA